MNYIMKFNLWASVLLFTASGLAMADFSYVLLDGQLVKVETPKSQTYSAQESQARINTLYVRTNSKIDRLSEVAGTLEAGSLVDSALYISNARAVEIARTNAKIELINQMKQDKASVGVVAVLTNADNPSALSPSAVIAEGKKWSRDYKNSVASTGKNVNDVLDPLLNREPQLKSNQQTTSSGQFGRIKEVFIGELSPDGKTIAIREMNKKDQDNYQNSKLEEQTKENINAEKIKLEEAKKKLQQAEILRDESAKREAETQKKKHEEVIKQQELAKATWEKKQKERDDSCNSGAKSCVHFMNELSNEWERRVKFQNTALCAQIVDGQGPRSGPCAEGSGGCINCRNLNSVNSERGFNQLLKERFSAIRIK